MGREVRMVPPDWKHPEDVFTGRYKPLHDGSKLTPDCVGFMTLANEKGLQEAIDYYGEAPNIENYMPSWKTEQATHYMMYEDTSEGTPISPAFATPEELARWLVDNKASSFGTNSTASYEAWLNIAKGGYAPSMIYLPETGIVDGVTASLMMNEEPKP